MAATQRCPACFLDVPVHAFQCPRCERLLIEDLAEVVSSARPPSGSVVRALVEKPRAELEPAEVRAPGLPNDVEKVTRPMRLPPTLDRVPKLAASLRMTELNLTPFEAWVVSLIDGRTNGDALSKILALSELETRVILQTLLDRSVIALTASQPRPAIASAPPSPVAENDLQTAVALEKSGNLAEAVRYLEFAIARSPDAAPLYNRLALVLIRERGDLKEAARLLDKAIQLAPGSEVYKHNRKALEARLRVAK